MALGAFNDLGEVLRQHQITLRQETFIEPVPFFVNELLQKRLTFFQANAPVDASPGAICEFYLAPILQEIWLPYADILTIWSHVSINGDDALSGVPDYFFAKRSPLGPIVRENPRVLFVAAKKDDFQGGWGQCLTDMLAAQKLHGNAAATIYGGVSNGRIWYFGNLKEQTLTQDVRAFTVTELNGLFAALNYIFQQAKQEVTAATPSPGAPS